MNIFTMAQLAKQHVWEDGHGFVTKSLGGAAGSEKIYVNIDILPPKAYSAKYHSHSQQEEFFLVLEGSGTLLLNDQEQPVQKGDFIAKPAGKGIAHTFYNSGDAPLVLLDVGTVEKEDTCYYPSGDVYLQKSCGQRRAFSGGGLLTDWTSAPDQKP